MHRCSQGWPASDLFLDSHSTPPNCPLRRQARIEGAVRAVIARLTAPGPNAHPANGWSIPPAILGNFGTNYAVRAQVALLGLAANLPADTIYPTAYVDAEGQGLSGAKRYVLHFDKDQLPPANAFWSVTMYTPDSFFVPNAIDRYALSSWMPLKFGADGSLDFYLQKDPPERDTTAELAPRAGRSVQCHDAPLLAEARGPGWTLGASRNQGNEVSKPSAVRVV